MKLGTSADAEGVTFPVQKLAHHYDMALTVAADHDLVTAGGVKLYVRSPFSDRVAYAPAFGLTGQGDETAKIAAVEKSAAFDSVNLGGLTIITIREQTVTPLNKRYFNGVVKLVYNGQPFEARPLGPLKDHDIEVTQAKSRVLDWKGRSLLWNGNSIAHEGALDGTSYSEHVARKLGAKVQNLAWSGSHIYFDADEDPYSIQTVMALSMTEADRRANRAIHGSSSAYDDAFNVVTKASQMTLEHRVTEVIKANAAIVGIAGLSHAFGRVTAVIGNDVTIAYDGSDLNGAFIAGSLYKFNRANLFDAFQFVFHAVQNTAIRFSAAQAEIDIVTANSYLEFTDGRPFESGVWSVGQHIKAVAEAWGYGHFDCAASMAITEPDRAIYAPDGTHPQTPAVREALSDHWCRWLLGGATRMIDPTGFLRTSAAAFRVGQVARHSPFTDGFETPARELGNLTPLIDEEFPSGLGDWTIAGDGDAPVVTAAPWDASASAVMASANAANQTGYLERAITPGDGWRLRFDIALPVTVTGVSGVRTLQLLKLRTSGGFFGVEGIVTDTTTSLRLRYFKAPSVDFTVIGEVVRNAQAGRRYTIEIWRQKATQNDPGRLSAYVDGELEIADFAIEDETQTAISKIQLGMIASPEEMLVWVTGNDNPEWVELMSEFDPTKTQARLFLILESAEGRPLSKEGIHNRLYFNRFDDAPEIEIIGVWIYHLRRKLQGTDYEIRTDIDLGYALIKAPKDKAV